jgi:SNF2 family DNA or RNA helicase
LQLRFFVQQKNSINDDVFGDLLDIVKESDRLWSTFGAFVLNVYSVNHRVRAIPTAVEYLKESSELSPGFADYIDTFLTNLPLEHIAFAQPPLVLCDDQTVGINWLGILERYNLNGILAGDMGLEKTLQTNPFLTLGKEMSNCYKIIRAVYNFSQM